MADKAPHNANVENNQERWQRAAREQLGRALQNDRVIGTLATTVTFQTGNANYPDYQPAEDIARIRELAYPTALRLATGMKTNHTLQKDKETIARDVAGAFVAGVEAAASSKQSRPAASEPVSQQVHAAVRRIPPGSAQSR